MYLGFQETPAPARPFDPDIVWRRVKAVRCLEN